MLKKGIVGLLVLAMLFTSLALMPSVKTSADGTQVVATDRTVVYDVTLAPTTSTPTPTPTIAPATPTPTLSPTPTLKPTPGPKFFIKTEKDAKEIGAVAGRFYAYCVLDTGYNADGYTTLSYGISGTAVNGVDYELISGVVNVVVGYGIGPLPQNNHPLSYIQIIPKANNLADGDKTVILTLSGSTATVVIQDGGVMSTPMPSATPIFYTVTFVGPKGTISSQLVEANHSANPPFTTLGEWYAMHYMFQSWVGSYDNITQDTVIQGNFFDMTPGAPAFSGSNGNVRIHASSGVIIYTLDNGQDPSAYASDRVKTNSNDVTVYVGYGHHQIRAVSGMDGLTSRVVDYEVDFAKPTPIPVTGVSISKTSATIKVPLTIQLSAVVGPAKVANKAVKWTSSNTKVATVSSTGKVTAKGPGMATIKVKTVSGAFAKTCKVTVLMPIKGVKLNKTSLSLAKGETYKLKAAINPTNASNKKATWKSSNTKILTVSSTGVVTAKAKGTAYVTVITSDGKKTARCKVNVK